MDHNWTFGHGAFRNSRQTLTGRRNNKPFLTRVTTEPLGSSSLSVAELRRIVGNAEVGREDTDSWIDGILDEVSYGLGQVLIIRLQRQLCGYAIFGSRNRGIYSIWVAKAYRGKGLANHCFGRGVVYLGVNYPRTVTSHDMLDEVRSLARMHSMTLDIGGPHVVLRQTEDKVCAADGPQHPAMSLSEGTADQIATRRNSDRNNTEAKRTPGSHGDLLSSHSYAWG